jgi:hypothetical protein
MVPLVVKKGGPIKQWIRKKRLWHILKHNGLGEFCPGQKLYKQEWNSGVITGARGFLEELALEWQKWWDIVLDMNDGIFNRDQMSFKYAYKKVAIDKYRFETIQPEYNWIVKKLGKNRYAKIFHRAGISDPKNLLLWGEIKEELLSGKPGIKQHVSL